MFKFVVYERTESGQLVRMHNVISLSVDHIWTRYSHREDGLIGWPEKTIYWNKETGPAFGFAPVTANTEKAINACQDTS